MEIILAKTAGFCFGVERAVKNAYKQINKKNVFTLGPIIHNDQVVKDLENNGIQVINNIEDIKHIENPTVIIRSHGIGEDVYLKLEKIKVNIIDTTCPYVKKIHNKVNQHSKLGYKIIIIGNKNHPEVKGIIGWCKSLTLVVNDIEQAIDINLNSEEKYCIVAQTTFNINKFKEIVEIIEKKVYDVIVFNTICNATNERQIESQEIAKQVDKMIIIGGKHSSNTQKLYEICNKYCKSTYHIETVKDIDLSIFSSKDKIGITAGASTPNNIIEEVHIKMSEFGNENSFEKLLEESFVSVSSGKIIKGNVMLVKEDEVILDIGYKSEGVIPKKEFTNNKDANLLELVKVGDELEAKVLKLNDGEGQVLLTYKRLLAEKGYKKIEQAYNNKEIIKAKVSEIVNKGVVVIINEARIFIPASLISDRFENDLNKYLNQEIEFEITEFNPRKKRIIGSRKQLLLAQREKQQKALFESIQQGMTVEGKVKSITDFGAFIDLGGIDGLLHISEMSWGRITNPKKLLKVNDTIKVLIKQIDLDNKKVSLSLKFPESNPWVNASEKFSVGTVVTGKVARMADFGAFIEIEQGVDALLHVSQISKEHVEKPSDILKVGEVITAKIVDFNEDDKKISLSIKALETKEDNNEVNEEFSNSEQ